jgi:hypothetical protein
MTTSRASQLSDLLRHKRRASRIPDLVNAWMRGGVSVSAFSNERHDELIARFRSQSTLREPIGVSLNDALSEFAQGVDMAAVIGWDVDEEPGVLLSAKALSQSETFFCRTYPAGFVIGDQPLTKLLVIDFDDTDMQIERVILGYAG